MTYELRDHTADVAVEATADTLSALFAAVADGLAAASAESVPDEGDRFEFEVAAEGREALLFDYLDRLIYERDVRLVLPADHRCAVVGPGEGDSGTGPSDPDEWRLTASARGVPLDAVAAREIKAVTYSEMALERRGDEWYAYVVFDV
ncbi:SHS2 domain-containing protein [Halorubrum xinjiangense]|uniref:SHS2 domain-containing protein n=1 Tax=Halorubrum xinjiangense TaxID=261291 RepID=A0A1G7L4Z2_9EURY|nr:archease [Halorubrum xinjiangense]SDF44404.1 SHS2 domain-containing protein [Halorubrum xinjiangense]